jgi:hypothetical protein
MKPSRLLCALAAGATALTVTMPASASADPSVSDPIATGLAGPLQIAVQGRDVFVGQSFAGVLTRVRPNGTTQDLTAQPGEVSGVGVRGGNVAFTFTGGDETDPVARLMLRRADGVVRTVADLYRFEKTRNPDRRVRYGFLGLSDACAAAVPDEVGGYPYHGLVDSHPYAVAKAPQGGWYVADAGGNSILRVRRNGHVSKVSVLPRQIARISPDAASAFGLPDCTIGKRYAFEAVPTDVEVDADGSLVVSLLPGGPEDASLGARGAVVRVGPRGGTTTIGTGFLGATNVAIGRNGTVYVAELFANRISMLRRGAVSTVVEVPSPASIEFSRGMIYASVDVFGAGSIVTVRP